MASSHTLSSWPKAEKTLIAVIIFIHLFLFYYVMKKPVYWQQQEITFHSLFWSMDDLQGFTLHSGFKKIDLKKIFAAKYVDGPIRTRYVSYFLEMLSFKFWQFLGVVSFKNFTLIGLHAFNVFLLVLLIFHLTKNYASACIGSLFFLNATTSLATLTFPFRNSKILVMMFFLLGFILLASSKGKFVESSPLRWQSFFLISVAALFTDEVAFFLWPLLIIFMARRDGVSSLKNRRFIDSMSLLVRRFIFFSILVFAITRTIEPRAFFLFQADYVLPKTMSYLGHLPLVIRDLALAFFGYFLRFNFGFWDWTVWGVMTAVASVVLFFLIFKNRPSPLIRFTALSIIMVIFIKAILLPHNSGFHRSIMPEGTFFPTPLFFNYYYTYIEGALISLVLGLLSERAAKNRKHFMGAMVMLGIIQLSNVMHLNPHTHHGVIFHSLDSEEKQAIFKNILAIKNAVNQNPQKKVYLSFPSDDAKVFKRGGLEAPESNYYASIIPVMYLRLLEKGKTTMSLQNVSHNNQDEGLKADIFYDVLSRESYDVEKIKSKNGLSDLGPIFINGDYSRTENLVVADNSVNGILFFIRGKSRFSVRINDTLYKGNQSYGYSYQAFKLPLPPKRNNSSLVLEIKVFPDNPESQVSLIGPLSE